MLIITNHGNGSYSYYSEEKQANRNIPSELGKAILEFQKANKFLLSQIDMNDYCTKDGLHDLKMNKAYLDLKIELNNPAKAFVEKVNQK